MITMKIVVHKDRDTRQVINTASRSILNDRYFTSLREDLSRNRYNPYTKSFQDKEREFDYRTRLEEKRALTTTRKKFAELSVKVSTEGEEESIKNSTEPSSIQLREPVLQFSKPHHEKPTTSEVSSTSAEKPNNRLTDSLLEIYKCRMCPNYAVPEVYECPSGHSVCEECWLVMGQCTLCPSESSLFRRALGMERIAALLKFPCRWRGCSESLESAAWRDHVDSCRHAEVQPNKRSFVSVA